MSLAGIGLMALGLYCLLLDVRLRILERRLRAHDELEKRARIARLSQLRGEP